MQDRTGLTVFLVRVVFVLFETRRFCKVARFVFPDLFLFSLERALPEKFHFFIEKIIRKSKQGSGKAMNQITQSRDYQLIIRLFVNRIFIFSKF